MKKVLFNTLVPVILMILTSSCANAASFAVVVIYYTDSDSRYNICVAAESQGVIDNYVENWGPGFGKRNQRVSIIEYTKAGYLRYKRAGACAEDIMRYNVEVYDPLTGKTYVNRPSILDKLGF